MRTRKYLGVGLGVVALVAAGMGGASAEAQTRPTEWSADWSAGSAAGSAGWSAAWASAMQAPTAADGNWSQTGFDHQTIRQTVRISTSGKSLRIRLSNLYGTKPLQITGITVARTDVTFHGSRRATIAPGRTATSDTVAVPTVAGQQLVVALYVDGATGPATFHEDGLTATTAIAGNHLHDNTPGTATSHAFYYLTGVDVTGAAGTLVAYGDSITNGHNSTVGADHRYSDDLAQQLATTRLGVANVGISGNLLLHQLPCFGDVGVTRFRRDALGQPGVRTVIVEEGENDIWDSEFNLGCGQTPRITADQLIAGYRSMIAAAHARGVRIIGGTITPFKADYMQPADFARAEAIRTQANQWIRTSGEYDAVADFARAVGDPADEQRLDPALDSGDHLHPNDAGYAALAAAAAKALGH